MRKILVTAIGGNVANGILKILVKGNDEIYGCDINDFPVGIDKVKVFWKSDLAVSPDYIPNLLNKCLYYGITHIIPVNESEINVISNNIDLFAINNIKLIMQNKSVLDICLDKLTTMRYLSKFINENIPRTFTFNEFVENNETYVVKLRNSCGSKFLKYISTRDELEDLPHSNEEYIVQEYLENNDEEYTIGLFADKEEINTIIFKRKLHDGYTNFVELVQIDEIEVLAKNIANIFNLRGYINIQLRKKNGKYKIFEINPRISGTVYFRHMLGFDDVIWWINLVDGIENPKYVQKYNEAIGMRELTEKFIVIK